VRPSQRNRNGVGGANDAAGREAEILDYWFTRDALHDPIVCPMVGTTLRLRGVFECDGHE